MRKERLLKFVTDHENVARAVEGVLALLNEVGADRKTAYKVRLALEELLVNVVSYAYAPLKGDFEVKYEVDAEEKMLSVTIIDSGKPFNPLEAEDPELHAALADRPIGGLGIFMVKNMMDDITYTREDGKNILVVKKSYQ